MAGDAIVSERIITLKSLLRSYGEIVVWCNHGKLPETECKSPAYFSAFCNNIFGRIWIFLFTSFTKQVSELFEPLAQFARGSE